MTIDERVRTPARRKGDLLARLERETDIWVATADAHGAPCLVPLWFVWHEESFWLCTRGTNPTGRNLLRGGRARLALGHTRDVVLVDGEVRAFGAGEVPEAAAAAFTAKTGWDPRTDDPAYAFFRVRPVAVQAWHGVRELRGRHLMRDGAWIV